MGWLCVPQTDRTRREGKVNSQAEAGQKLGECKVKRIYIAGPMTGLPELNRAEFRKAVDFIWKALKETAIGFNPHQVADMLGWTEETPPSEIASMLLGDLIDCHAIYMLRGWENSKGARAEHAVAVWIGLEIIYQGGEG